MEGETIVKLYDTFIFFLRAFLVYRVVLRDLRYLRLPSVFRPTSRHGSAESTQQISADLRSRASWAS